MITEGYGVHQENYFAIDTYDYLGERTHPNGTEWIIIKAEVVTPDAITTEIGFAPKEEAEANFVTNKQLKTEKFLNVLDILAVAGEAALLEKKDLESIYDAELAELRQQLHAAQRQAQQNQRQVQQTQQQVYQCQKCDLYRFSKL